MGEGTPEHIANLDTPTGLALKEIMAPTIHGHLHPKLTSNYSRKVKHKDIVVKNALTHNLKNLDVLPFQKENDGCHRTIWVRKSSLAFHTVFAEGQLRYIESLSTYARRFLGRMKRPPVDEIQGLAPAIAIDQSNRGKSSRSTVATSTEIYDILRIYTLESVNHIVQPVAYLFTQLTNECGIESQEIRRQRSLLAGHYPSTIGVEHLLNDGIVQFGRTKNK